MILRTAVCKTYFVYIFQVYIKFTNLKKKNNLWKSKNCPARLRESICRGGGVEDVSKKTVLLGCLIGGEDGQDREGAADQFSYMGWGHY